MGEPVVIFVVGDLFLLASVGRHTPYLHRAGTDGIEIDIFPIGGIFGAVVKALGSGELYFLTSRRRYFIHIELSVPFSTEDQVLAVGRPAMQVRGSFGCDLPGCAALDRNGINDGASQV